MNDPHVTALHYTIQPPENVDYDKAVPLKGQTDAFEYTLAEGEATVIMKTHFATEREAREVADQFLCAWSIYTGVTNPSQGITFHFEKADIVDRRPASPEESPDVLAISVTAKLGLGETLSVHISNEHFPDPPQRFVSSPDVETMYLRYQMYCQGRETLAAMAYACLTVLEASVGPKKGGLRAKAVKRYKICKTVLNTLGHLVSEKGGTSEGRKMPRTGPPMPLTGQERQWIEAVVRRIILRAGEYRYDSSDLPQVTMNDFPKLP